MPQLVRRLRGLLAPFTLGQAPASARWIDGAAGGANISGSRAYRERAASCLPPTISRSPFTRATRLPVTTTHYTPALTGLMPIDHLPKLGPGIPRSEMRRRLATTTAVDLFDPQPIRDLEMARCCLAGLWLAYDFLDESHAISQEIHTTSGSFWHAIMHRREGDFGNAKYWFHRVGRHEVYPELCRAARELVGADTPPEAKFLAEQASWDADAFVDLVERCTQGRSATCDLCRQIAKAEWQLLFDYCHRQAT